MLRRLAHRGPDDEGSVRLGSAWLGQRRLAIVDVAGGAQPIADEGENLHIVANGEIYNHQELRSALPRHSFRSRSDSEAALHLFEQEGAQAIARLEGMYAFAIAGKHGRFLAARDPVGIKPLYWAEDGRTHLFASELKAFDRACLRRVREFPPGHSWTPDGGLVRFAELPLSPSATPSRTLERAEQELRTLLEKAVARRMMSDVPLGVFLSGGLDSSIVAAIAARIAERDGRRLKSFAVGSEGSPDLLAAREVATFIGTEHHEAIFDPSQAQALLPTVIRSMELFDPSTVRSALANYLVAELAGRHVKVVLTGEGSDELFAGYRYVRSLAGLELHEELQRSVLTLHNLNLQRCDRTTMAYGHEARVPFLDLEVIGYAMALPPEWKLYAPESGGPLVEKWILRRAFDGYLPHGILWRTKSQFGDGSGMRDALKASAPPSVADAAAGLRTAEEAHYFSLFAEDYAGVDVAAAVGRCEAMV